MKYWFKRRRYGYGWVPVSYQGWLTITGYLAVLLITSFTLLKDTTRNTYTPEVNLFILLVAICTAILIVIARAKGPSPKWRWGQKSSDDPDKDW